MDLITRWLTLAVIILVCAVFPGTSALIDRELVALCSSYPTKHVVPHPHDCAAYIECFNGPPIVRSCGQGLHYNERKGVCDYLEVARCNPDRLLFSKGYRGTPLHAAAGPPPYTHKPPSGPSPLGFPQPSLNPPRGKFKDHRGRQSKFEASHRSTYEETVYGEFTRRSEHGNTLRSYDNRLMQEAKEYVKDRMKGELYLYKEMYGIVDSGPYRMVSRFLNARSYVKTLSQPGMANLQIMKLTRERYGGSTDIMTLMKSQGLMDLLKPLPGVYEPDTQMVIPPDIDYCPYPERLSCYGKALKYRMTDGSCNNLDKPLWGRSLTPFGRMVDYRYDDGIEAVRRSVTGRPLPGPRHISSRLFPDVDIPQQSRTMMMVFWGQLIDHDLTLTAITEVPVDDSFDDTTELKCGFDGCQTSGPGLDACWPIPVPHDDSDFPYNRCLKFVRSAEVPPLSCKAGPREQLNQATHWLDASMVYGVTKEDSNKLRDISNRARGKMTIRNHPDGSSQPDRTIKNVLPSAEDDVCRDVNQTHSCYLAGDERVNENAGLTVYHTALIREHNRIEEALHEINPHWKGERLYQETRRILTAMVQHIVFNEFLPVTVGSRAMKELDLELLTSGYYHGYNPGPDPRIPNSFAAAAFRFGHTLLQERMRRMNDQYVVDDALFLSETLFRPVHSYSLKDGGLDSLARGLANFPCQSYDQFVTKQVTNHLFTEIPPFGPGMDLLSLNIQRGRDHGIGTYNDFRETCGIGRAQSFDDLSGEVRDSRALDALKRVYDHVDDIDIFAGGISERFVRDGQIGPTFACMVGRTFQALRQGDRFWYENDNKAGFTPGQLQEIRKSTLSRIVCANMDNLAETQKWIFMLPTDGGYDNNFGRFAENIEARTRNNPRVPCDSLPDPDLMLWKTRQRY